MRSSGGPRKITYMAIEEINVSPDNPKEHDLGFLHESMSESGYVEPMTWDERTSTLISGHGRLKTLLQRMAQGQDPPEGIVAENGTWFVPVTRGWASKDDILHDKCLIALNRAPELGGWNEDLLAKKLQGVDNSVDNPVDESESVSARLRGSGFDSDDVDALVKRLQRPLNPEGVEIDCPRCLGTGKIHTKPLKPEPDSE